MNYILLIFQYYVQKTIENGSLDLKDLKTNNHRRINIEKQVKLNKPENKTKK